MNSKDFAALVDMGRETFVAQANRATGDVRAAFLAAATRMQGLVIDFQSHPFKPEQILALIDTNKAELASDLGIIKENEKRAFVANVFNMIFSGLLGALGG